MSTLQHLSTDEFDALATGLGGSSAINTLRRGRLGKHIVMLHALHRFITSEHPDLTSQMNAAFTLLSSAQQRDPRSVDSILLHPSVGTWAAGCLRILTGAEHSATPLSVNVGHLAAIAAVAAYRTGLPFEISVPTHHGAVLLPTLGLAHSEEGRTQEGWATISHKSGRIRITVGERQIAVPPDPTEDSYCWAGLRRLNVTAAGLTIELEVDDLDPRRGNPSALPAGRLDEAELQHWRATLGHAWNILVQHHRERAYEMSAGLVALVPVLPAAPGGGTSVTSREAFGSIMTSRPSDGLGLAETMIHEFNHSKLYALTDLVDLHNTGSDAVHYSPWRDDPRPVEGVLHGIYSYLGITDFWDVQRRILQGPQQEFAEFEFSLWSRQVAKSIDALSGSVQLTSMGTRFVNIMAKRAAEWSSQSTPERPRMLADLAIADHRVRWRLRHQRPAQGIIDELASKWRSGGRPPSELSHVPTTVAPAEGALQLSPRIALIHCAINDPSRFGSFHADPAHLGELDPALCVPDLLLLEGDLRGAESVYLENILADPNDIESWAGLSLTRSATDPDGALATAPEVLRAFFLALLREYGTTPDLRG